MTVLPYSAFVAGRFYDTTLAMGATAGVTAAANTLYGLPICVTSQVTVALIGVEATSTSGSARFGIYTDANGVPDALVVDAGATPFVTGAFRGVAISQVLTVGWYWLAGVFSATPNTRGLTNANCIHYLGFSSGTDTTPHIGVSVSFTYGALPNPFTGGSALITANPPRIMIGV